MASSLPVAGIGISTVENIPVFHYDPGGMAFRVILACRGSPLFECGDFDICAYGSPAVFQPHMVGVGEIVRRAVWSGADMILFEGLEPCKCLDSETLEAAREEGLHVAVRTFGSGCPAGLEPDVIIYDDIHEYAEDPSIILDLQSSLERSIRAGNSWVEVNAYIPDPRTARIAGLLEILGGKLYPLHVHAANHMGGGPVRSLYEKARRVLPHLYIHNPTYPYLETYCPACGKPVAMREEGVLLKLEAREGRCWNCGAEIPFHGRIRDKTPRRVIQLTGGGRWMHPLELKAIGRLFSSRTSGRRDSGSPSRASPDG